MLNIAIDGPSGAGKSSVAKCVSSQMGILYLDTGALYRSIGLFALQHDIDTTDESKISAILSEIDIKLEFIDGTQHIFLNGVDVSSEIRTQPVAMAASNVSALPIVRQFLLGLQRDIASKNDCIMDGRDIGTVVLPNASLKIFLTASAEERANRRVGELENKGIAADYETVLKEIIERDYNDSHRDIAPLKPASDSRIVDTTDLSFDEVVQVISSMVEGIKK